MLRKFNKDPAPQNMVANPLFERAIVESTTPADWTEVNGGLPNSANFGRYTWADWSSGFASTVDNYVHLVSAYHYTIGLYNDSQSITDGDYFEIKQTIDFTNIDEMVYTLGGGAKVGQDGAEIEVYIDDVLKDGLSLGVGDGSFSVFANRVIDTSALIGALEMRIRLTAGTTIADSWAAIELANFRAFENSGRNGPVVCLRDEDVSGVTASVGSDSATEPIANALNLVPSDHGASNSFSDLWVKLDFGSSPTLLRKNINFMALFKANFVEGEVVTWEAHPTDSWGSPDHSVVMTWDNGTLYAETANRNPIAYRYHRIISSGVADRADEIQVGSFVFGTSHRFSQMYSIGERFERNYGALINKSSGGREWAKKKHSQGLFRAAFEDLVPEEIYEYLWLAQQAHGSFRPFACVVAPDDPDYSNLVILGRLLSQPQTPEKEFELYDQDFVMRELTWGRTV